jgi:hypothetical protein
MHRACAGPIALNVIDRAGDFRVSGETIDGYVDIDVARARKERLDTIQVEFIGSVITRVHRL